MNYVFGITLYLGRNVPRPLRQQFIKHRDWLKALLVPAIDVLDIFRAFRAKILQDLSYSNVTKVYERLLNDYFPEADGGIWIDNKEVRKRGFYVHTRNAESAKVFKRGANKDAVFTRQTDIDQYEFIIWYPTDVDPIKLNAVVVKYCYAGIKYQLQSY